MKMATRGSAKCTGRSEQKCQASSAGILKTSYNPPLHPLTLEEVRCPVCSEILLEPVTMPCSHSVCLHCFKRTVECSSQCCPLCRLRVSSWARKQSNSEKGLVNTELWDVVRKSYPERCKSRMEQRDCDSIKDIFISPAQISRSGEILSEQIGNQKVLINEEKEEGRRKVFQLLKEECGTVKHIEDPFHGVLSDSENEEPIGKRTRNVSAFVRRTKNSPAFTRDGAQKNVQRSQSCTDSVEGRGKLRTATHPPTLDKVGIAHCYNAGILLSSENSRRSLSAPITVPDKRHGWRYIMTSSTPLGGPLAKQERSISPESNDSISEELNHFKPIVCSPCTPPKRLPDGRVMEPTIVKSTPRNLTRSLQRATSYEASPTILQKWRQIEVDRQSIKVMSKSTLTSPINEHPVKMSSVEEHKPCVRCAKKLKERFGVCTVNTHSPPGHDNERVFTLNKRRLIFDQQGETDSCQKQSIKVHVPALHHNSEGPLRESADFPETVIAPESCRETLFSKKQSFSTHAKNSGFQSYKLSSKDTRSPRKEPGNSSCIQNQSTSRKGKKRSQKTKHLEETESGLKRSRPVCQEAFDIEYCENDLYIQQIQQEREDRALALKLQRQFDLENQRVNKQKRSPEKYFLRSWMSHQNRRRHSPRTSRRISKKH